jgi:hypothetical protein
METSAPRTLYTEGAGEAALLSLHLCKAPLPTMASSAATLHANRTGQVLAHGDEQSVNLCLVTQTADDFEILEQTPKFTRV